MRALLALALLSLAAPASAQEFTAPDGVNKCFNSGVTMQCTLLGVLSPGAATASMTGMSCDDGCQLVMAERGPMCAKDLKPPK